KDQQEEEQRQPTCDHHAHVVIHATPRYQCRGNVHNDSDMPRPRYHAALSLAVAAVVVARTRQWRDALPVLVAGVLVDLDHLVDLAATRATGKTEWIILPLHAWEWVFGLIARRTRLADLLAAGLAPHLALDQLNPGVSHP